MKAAYSSGMAGLRSSATVTCRTRKPGRARSSSTFTPPASTARIARCCRAVTAVSPTFPTCSGAISPGGVAALGDGVDEFAPGDPVFGVCEVGQEGAHAEKIAVKAALVARKPAPLSHVDAAAVALIGLTAVVSIEDTLALQPGERILIQGGAGGVAGFGIQLAKHVGAHVIATCSARNVDYVHGLGADEVIDYNAQDFGEAVSDCDAVFETVGGEVAQRSFAVLRPEAARRSSPRARPRLSPRATT